MTPAFEAIRIAPDTKESSWNWVACINGVEMRGPSDTRKLFESEAQALYFARYFYIERCKQRLLGQK